MLGFLRFFLGKAFRLLAFSAFFVAVGGVADRAAAQSAFSASSSASSSAAVSALDSLLIAYPAGGREFEVALSEMAIASPQTLEAIVAVLETLPNVDSNPLAQSIGAALGMARARLDAAPPSLQNQLTLAAIGDVIAAMPPDLHAFFIAGFEAEQGEAGFQQALDAEEAAEAEEIREVLANLDQLPILRRETSDLPFSGGGGFDISPN